MASFTLRCTECSQTFSEDPKLLVCPACSRHQERGREVRGALTVEIDTLPARWPTAPMNSPETLLTFWPLHRTDVLPDVPVGQTPLLTVPALREELGLKRLFVKDDSRNPSGSYKDRASLLVVAKAREYGITTIAAASTGNAATALSALGAAARLRCVVFVPASTPEAKLVQMQSYGALVLPVAGSYDDAFELSIDACKHFGWYNRNTALNPFTTEGKKTSSLEIAYDLHHRHALEADAVLVPVGDGVIISGVAKGFRDLLRAGLIRKMPRLIAIQPERSPALVNALRSGGDTVQPFSGANSVADSLNVDVPRHARLALREIRQSGGTGLLVTEDMIFEAIGFMASRTGVFPEPAGATAVAGLREAVRQKIVAPDETVVTLVTGTGLKDIKSAAKLQQKREPIALSLEAVQKALGSAL
jgi:threonine synthase